MWLCEVLAYENPLPHRHIFTYIQCAVDVLEIIAKYAIELYSTETEFL